MSRISGALAAVERQSHHLAPFLLLGRVLGRVLERRQVVDERLEVDVRALRRGQLRVGGVLRAAVLVLHELKVELRRVGFLRDVREAEAAELLAVRVAPQAVAQAVRAMADMRATDVWGAISIHKSPQA